MCQPLMDNFLVAHALPTFARRHSLNKGRIKIITKIPISGNSDTNLEESTRDLSRRSRALCQDDIRSCFPRR